MGNQPPTVEDVYNVVISYKTLNDQLPLSRKSTLSVSDGVKRPIAVTATGDALTHINSSTGHPELNGHSPACLPSTILLGNVAGELVSLAGKPVKDQLEWLRTQFVCKLNELTIRAQSILDNDTSDDDDAMNAVIARVSEVLRRNDEEEIARRNDEEEIARRNDEEEIARRRAKDVQRISELAEAFSDAFKGNY